MRVKKIVLIAVLAAILFVQEEALTFLPNVQLTVFLIVLYTKLLKLKDVSIILLIHVLLDNISLASFNPIYVVTMYVGWMAIVLLIHTTCKHVENELILALVGMIGSFIYCWIYLIPNTIIMNIPLIPYLRADILFEIILALSSFISIYFLYQPISKVLKKQIKQIM